MGFIIAIAVSMSLVQPMHAMHNGSMTIPFLDYDSHGIQPSLSVVVAGGAVVFLANAVGEFGDLIRNRRRNNRAVVEVNPEQIMTWRQPVGWALAFVGAAGLSMYGSL